MIPAINYRQLRGLHRFTFAIEAEVKVDTVTSRTIRVNVVMADIMVLNAFISRIVAA